MVSKKVVNLSEIFNVWFTITSKFSEAGDDSSFVFLLVNEENLSFSARYKDEFGK